LEPSSASLSESVSAMLFSIPVPIVIPTPMVVAIETEIAQPVKKLRSDRWALKQGCRVSSIRMPDATG
jgi:hypothetical protein